MRKVADGGCDVSNETNEQPIQIIDEKQDLILLGEEKKTVGVRLECPL